MREPGDPVGGQTAPPCVSCALLGTHFGFRLSPPVDSGPEQVGEAGDQGGAEDA